MFSTTSRFVLANLFTPSYRILGRIQVSNTGLIGLMNDPNTSSIEVLQVSLARLQEPKVITERTEQIRVVKRGILLIGVGKESEIGPTLASRTGIGRVERHWIRSITGTFEVTGQAEYAGRFDLATVLVESGDFFPIYNATLRAIRFPDL